MIHKPVAFTTQPALMLASSSSYRQACLRRLQLPFTCLSPDIDETPLPQELAQQTAIRLARGKAQSVANKVKSSQNNLVVIGSDQVADLNGHALSKPGTKSLAVSQLQNLSGQSVVFYSAVCVLGPTNTIEFCVPTHAQYRNLTDADIEHYVELEPSFDCAGAAKSEGLGISLLSRMASTDPTAILGLPLIELCHALRSFGFRIP